MKRIKKWPVLGMTLIAMFLFAGVASAHVTVWPKEAAQNSYEVFSVRVPSEKENVTTKIVKVKVPDGVKISRVEPKAGWKYELEQNADTKDIASITWTAEGDGLAQTEFTEFRVSGKVAADAKQLIWKAYQTYSDNSVVEWVGGDGADYPASVTTVTAASGEGDGHGGGSSGSVGTDPNTGTSSGSEGTGNASSTNAGNEAGTPETADNSAAAAQENASTDKADSGSDTLNRTLSIVAVALAAAALGVAVSRKRQR
ncbi:YcnI family protein [Paenibacillus lignilyticus]|uniref:YcnI family protein n=1 Tax=Paenibacillus lignilyticus TaxID=1172615 RepID=A0ABS5C7X4_9BACL|nr:YcnI family protein [Paenibacillus lignilyticus]MBP3962087.1 YcnI family protein [Paenibacillus lignilyticus]